MKNGGTIMKIRVYSEAFENMQEVPERYTIDGEGVSPPLAWDNIPENTKSLVLLVDDQDAPGGNFVHWLLYDIPPSVRKLPEFQNGSGILPNGAVQGINSSGRIGYFRFSPPYGTHRYVFKIFALDKKLNLPPGKDKKQIERAMDGHVIAWGELLGVYAR
jgi:Raf kinase inhibitor-like YbhB/YbcL family protein